MEPQLRDERRSDSPWATARICAGRGWPVLPLAPGRKTPAANCPSCRLPGHTHEGCSCLGSGRWCHGFHAATVDPELVQQWWGRRAGLGVGVACGPAGLVVVDIDAHKRRLPARDRILPGIPIGEGVDLKGLATGFHSLSVLAALHGAADPAADTTTLRVRTPSGGLHVWYRALPGQRWLCSTGSGAGRALAWQVDVRAHGGYIVAPGTTTQAGTYTALDPAREPAPLPSWLAAELERTGHLASPQRPGATAAHAAQAVRAAQGLHGFHSEPRARHAVRAAGGGRQEAATVMTGLLADVADCASVAEGAGFSEKLNRAAYTVGGLVAAGHLGRAEAERMLEAVAAVARPGQERRYRAIILGGLRAGAVRPLALWGQR